MPPSPITSRHNPRVKHAAALRNRKQREVHGQTLVHGARECERAFASGARIVCALLCPTLFTEGAKALADRLTGTEFDVYELTGEVFEKIVYGDRYDGVTCVVETRPRRLESLVIESAAPLIAVIEQVEKPGNLGALLRTADGAGVDAVLVADPVIDLDNPNAIRASVGMTFRENIAVATARECRDWLVTRGVQVYAMRPDAEITLWQARLSGGCALVFGSESQGLTDAWQSPAVTPVALPMHGHGDSLNVSASAAVALYEAVRQRSL